MKSNRRTVLIIFLIAIAAIILRLYALDRLPPGLFGDEAVEGLDALDVLAGNFAIWFHAHLGREPIYVYLVALSYRAFGVTPLATRLPAVIAGLLTIPAAFLFTREWTRSADLDPNGFIGSSGAAKPLGSRTRIPLLTTALLAISFWHIQMTRDAHRDTLLPLVEALGFWLLLRALRTRDWKIFAASGAILGLAIYTYSPGRFVGIFVALFVAVEFIAARLTGDRRPVTGDRSRVERVTDEEPATSERDSSVAATGRWSPVADRSSVVGLGIAAVAAVVVMLPLGIYFAQNPAQFSRRFESVSVLDADSPPAALVASVSGNLAQFVVPDAGYQSKHYNLPGKPIFDLFIAPWFLAGVVIAITRWRQSAYRFLLLWFVVMLVPAFLTADMIPKGVRALGVVPGVFVFPALAMDYAISIFDFRFSTPGRPIENRKSRVGNWGALARVAVIVCIVGSVIWTAYDYYVAWANMPELPLAFDADMTEVSSFLQRQPANQPIYISSQVYRPPTEMLLGRLVATSRYLDRATTIREFDAHTQFVFNPRDRNAIYVFVREQTPPEDWLARIAPQATMIEQGSYFAAYRLGALASAQQPLDLAFNPLLKLTGATRYDDGIALYWQVTQLPSDRVDTQATISVADGSGAVVTQGKHLFGYPPLEWNIGDVIVEWYAPEMPDNAAQFSIQLTRGDAVWKSLNIPLK